LQLTGNHDENPTMDLPSRDRAGCAGKRSIEVIGPVSEVETEISALHRDFWNSPWPRQCCV
jgi:hypothetical protein